MRICMVLEGCYPYVRGGVSTWMHQIITANPQNEYVLWLIAAKREDQGQFKYEMPKQVVEIHEVFMEDALHLKATKRDYYHFSESQIKELKELVLCQNPDWDTLFQIYNRQHVGAMAFLMSETFLQILLDICENDYPYVPFAEFFHSIRSMFLPILYLLGMQVPKADVYHATSTGYGGLLAALGAWRYERPCIITEHGIYTREREEEILRAQWIPPQFRQQWINMFFMLSHCAYDRANRVTSLFGRYAEIQVELGCQRYKQKVIENGIHVERFESIEPKIPNGFIDITAVVRIHPIKDIKTLIQAFFDLKQRITNARLHILGDTDDQEYAEECRHLMEELGAQDIDMPGNVNVIEYLKETDFTVLSSISEGQPLAVLESLAAGRPCVTTDVGCCRELLEGGAKDSLGIAGIVVPPMHSQALANAMETLCKEPRMRQEMALVGRRRVQTYYRHEDMIRHYNENYEEVLKEWQASVSS